MLAKFIKILIALQANPERGEEQKKDFNKYHQCDISNSLVSVYRNFILLVEVVSNFIPPTSYLIVLIFPIISIKNKTQLNNYK